MKFFFRLNEIYGAYMKGSKIKVIWNNKEIQSSNGKYICMAQMLIHHWVERTWFSCQMTCHKNKIVAMLTLYILNKHNCMSPISVSTFHLYNYFFTVDHCGLSRAILGRLTYCRPFLWGVISLILSFRDESTVQNLRFFKKGQNLKGMKYCMFNVFIYLEL